MPITSTEDAHYILDTQAEGIPYEAIHYLRYAYSGTGNNEPSDRDLPTPIWYSIVAETHLDPRLIDPVISLVTSTEADWDFLNEQAECLIGRLAEAFPEQTVAKVLTAMEVMCAQNAPYPYLFLFDAFYFVDPKVYEAQLLELFQHPGMFWLDALAIQLANLKINAAVPILRRLILEQKQLPDPESGPRPEAELEEALLQLETGLNKYPEMARPTFQQHSDWEEHYRQYEDRFYANADEEDDLNDEELAVIEAETEAAFRSMGLLQPAGTSYISDPKPQRNDPCPCGSGKKFKKCHGAS